MRSSRPMWVGSGHGKNRLVARSDQSETLRSARVYTWMAMKVAVFHLIIPLVLCPCVTAQSASRLVPVPTPTVAALTPTPSPSPIFRHPLDCPLTDTSRCDPACPYINTECPAPGLLTSQATFEQREICAGLANQTLTAGCSFVGGGIAFLCK